MISSEVSRPEIRSCRVSVEPALFLYMFASFLSYPVYQELLFHTFCVNDFNCSSAVTNLSTGSCNSFDSSVVHYQKKASHWVLYTNLASGLPAILLSLVYGSLSDIFDRKYFMIIPAVGGAINSLIIIIVQYTNPNHLWMYLIGASISGVTGSFSVFNFNAYAYVADCSSHDSRTQRISQLEATTYISSFLSVLLSGVWVKSQGYTIPFFGVLACQVTVVFYLILVLPSYKQKRHMLLLNSKKNHEDVNLMTSIFTNILAFFKIVFTSWRLSMLSIMFFVLEVNFLGITDTVVLYSLTRLCWSSGLLGYFLAEKSFFNAISALVALPILIRLKVKDTFVAIIGLFAGATALVIMGVANHSWIMFIGELRVKRLMIGLCHV